MDDGQPHPPKRPDDSANGSALSADELVARLYSELHELARRKMKAFRPGQTLQPTALIHETYLKLTGRGDPGWRNEGHFLGAAAIAMRNILVDQARRRDARKRGGDRRRTPLDHDLLPFDHDPAEVLALNEALTDLERVDPRKAQIVTMHSFAGLPQNQIARALDLSTGTIEREWRFARAWLRKRMSSGGPAEDAR
jgi:RNA polymerase sigma factor (TIGR02999 family)